MLFLSRKLYYSTAIFSDSLGLCLPLRIAKLLLERLATLVLFLLLGLKVSARCLEDLFGDRTRGLLSVWIPACCVH
jgi:hypothetical protein